MVLKHQWACSSPAVLGKSADSLVPPPPPPNILTGMRPRNLHLKNQPRRFCCNGSFEKHGLEEGSTQGFLAEDQELTSKGMIKSGTWGGVRYCPSVSVGWSPGLVADRSEQALHFLCPFGKRVNHNL